MAVFGALFILAGVWAYSVAISAWGLMLASSTAHNIWWSSVPALGYGDAFSIVFMFSIPLAISAVVIGLIRAIASDR
jgi:hypothetical protein